MKKDGRHEETSSGAQIDGPFTGFLGEVKEVDVHEQAVKVAAQVFGRVTPVDLALGQIELVPKHSN
jgi:transcription antitermination factor NusG